MVVYAVEEHSGSYEDYRCDIEHIFLERKKAEEYIEKSKAEWDNRKERSQMCEACPFVEAVYEVKNIELFEEKGKKECPNFELNREGMNLECDDIIYDDDEIPKYRIKEYEVE